MTAKQAYGYGVLTTLLIVAVASTLLLIWQAKGDRLAHDIASFYGINSYRVKMPQTDEFPNGFDVRFYLKKNDKIIKLPGILGLHPPYSSERTFIFSRNNTNKLVYKFGGLVAEFDLEPYLAKPNISSIPVPQNQKYLKPKHFFLKFGREVDCSSTFLNKDSVGLYFDFVPRPPADKVEENTSRNKDTTPLNVKLTDA